MDLAAQRIQSLAQRILPDRPHHLSLSSSRRYPVPPNFVEHHSNLQYSTFLCDTDRGILLTRPYYEIHEEPESRDPSPANASLRPDAKKAVTKMSFRDYQNSKKKMSLSPLDAPARPDARHADDARPAVRGGPRPSDPREDANRRPRASSRERARNGRSPSPDAGRRSPEPLDGTRPRKKARVDAIGRSDASRTPLHDTPSTKHTPSSSVNRPVSSQKEHRTSAPQPTNGRSISSTHRNGETSASSPQRHGANGLKSSMSTTSSRRPPEPATASKPSVPPLLSPLRLSFDEHRDNKSRSPAKRPADSGGAPKTLGKSEKTDGSNGPRKHKSPPQIPPLLSPTLPAVVEEELLREDLRAKKVTLSKSEPSQAPGAGQGESQAERNEHPRLLVTLKYKKRTAVTVQRLLALPPSSFKEALRKERSMSDEVGSPPAKKRPRPAEGIHESTASKRPKMAMDSISVTKTVAPSTPLKTATAMSRAASSNSLAQTPSDGPSLTPRARERPTTSHDGDAVRSSSHDSLVRRHKEYLTLGTQLKHKRDDILRSLGANAKSEGSAGSPDMKRVAVLSLEMIMAYVVAFEALNQARAQVNKPGEFSYWESLVPHLGEVKVFTQKFKPLQGVALQLHAIVLEELMRVFYGHDPSVVGSKMQRCGRKIYDTWVEAHNCVGFINEGPMKVALGPWVKPAAAAAAALLVVRRWADREGVDWRPILVLPVANGI